jgi:hypothetical protein
MKKKATDIKNIIKNNGFYFAEYRLLHGDEIKYYLGRGKLFFDSNNNPEYMVGIVFDQTEEKKTIKKLIENLRKYLDETSKKALLGRRKDENDFRDEEIKRVPYTIYVG